MNIHILKFLYKSLLGRNTDLKNSEQLVMICIEKAYKDMLRVVSRILCKYFYTFV